MVCWLCIRVSVVMWVPAALPTAVSAHALQTLACASAQPHSRSGLPNHPRPLNCSVQRRRRGRRPGPAAQCVRDRRGRGQGGGGGGAYGEVRGLVENGRGVRPGARLAGDREEKVQVAAPAGSPGGTSGRARGAFCRLQGVREGRLASGGALVTGGGWGPLRSPELQWLGPVTTLHICNNPAV